MLRSQLKLTLEGIVLVSVRGCMHVHVCGFVCVHVVRKRKTGRGGGDERGGKRNENEHVDQKLLGSEKSNLLINDYPFRGNQCQQKLP